MDSIQNIIKEESQFEIVDSIQNFIKQKPKLEIVDSIQNMIKRVIYFKGIDKETV